MSTSYTHSLILRQKNIKDESDEIKGREMMECVENSL